MRAVEIVVMEEEGEELGAVVAGEIRAGISPFPSDGLDEAFGFAIGLGAIRTSEEVAQAQIFAGGGEEFGAIGRATIGEDGLDGDAVGLIKGECLLEGGEDAGDFFIGEKRGKSQAAVVINGDVEGLDAGAGIAMGAIAGGADAGLVKAAQLFNIQMKQLAGRGAFVTHDRRLGRIEGRQAVETMALEDAGKGSFGDGKDHEDLSVRTALAAEGEDLVFELGRSFARLTLRSGGSILQARRRAGLPGALEPLADGFFGDSEGGCGGS
jgi:hypothetical protein